MRRLPAAVLAAAFLVVWLPGRGGAAPAPPPPAPADVPSRLALVAQDPWTPLGGTFHARLTIAASTRGEQLSVIAHDATATRSNFDNGDLGPVLKTLTLPVDLLATEVDGSRDLTVGVSGPTGAFDANRLGLPGRGVYPLELKSVVPQHIPGDVERLGVLPGGHVKLRGLVRGTAAEPGGEDQERWRAGR